MYYYFILLYGLVYVFDFVKRICKDLKKEFRVISEHINLDPDYLTKRIKPQFK